MDGDKKHKIIANNAVEFKAITGIDHHVFGLTENIHYPDYKFEKQLAEEAKTGDINAIADKYADAINDIFYVEESGVAEEEQKPEEKKNAEKRVELRRRFVFSCRALFDILEGEPVEKLTAEQKKNVKLALDKLNHKHITVDDIIATVSLNLDLNYGIGTVDNIDHLGNRRVR